MKLHKASNKYFSICVGPTKYSEQTIGVGIGRVKYCGKDYFLLALIFFIVFLNIRIKLPEFIQRED